MSEAGGVGKGGSPGRFPGLPREKILKRPRKHSVKGARGRVSVG
jgi:hypothetical protein